MGLGLVLQHLFVEIIVVRGQFYEALQAAVAALFAQAVGKSVGHLL
jgi:hypothetical protein